jgi:hypothetical protein
MLPPSSVFWVVTQCTVVVEYRCFRSPCTSIFSLLVVTQCSVVVGYKRTFQRSMQPPMSRSLSRIFPPIATSSNHFHTGCDWLTNHPRVLCSHPTDNGSYRLEASPGQTCGTKSLCAVMSQRIDTAITNFPWTGKYGYDKLQLQS